jgi:propanol-preferring alcohol dehydrogenase
LVRVAACGACHSDLHVMAAIASGKSWFTPPFTLGHETTGWIEAAGPDARGAVAGEAVAVYCAWGCGSCRACLASSENYCIERDTLRGGGLGADGGMAPYMLVPSSRYLVPLGGVDPLDAAPLTDAGLTPYHAIKRASEVLVPDATAVVIGIGGLGHMAIQILRAITAVRIVAVDVSDAKLALARDLGADETVRSDGEAGARLRELLHGGLADAVFDFAGVQASIDLGRRLVRPDGVYSIVGLGGGTLPFTQGKIAWGARVSTPFYGSIGELREVIGLAARGRLGAHATRFPLARAADAYRAMHDGTLEGRAVIVPG